MQFRKQSHFNMCKALKIVIVCVYCGIFLFSLKYLIFDTKEDIIEINYKMKTAGALRKILKEIKKYRGNKSVITMDFERPTRLPGDFKYILKWYDGFSKPRSLLNGQKSFFNYNCTYNNCYLTNDKSLLIDMRNFDAILFDVEADWDEHPPLRTPHQNYIFSATESASNYAICDPNFDSHYNLSWTYKLDSDIPKSLIKILDKNGVVVGPKINMKWKTPMLPTSEDVKSKIKGKKKAAAWFLSGCGSANSKARENFVRELNISMAKMNLTLDIYGWCGKLRCPKDRIEECLLLLRRDYFFYLSFEYSISEDFVTEEILYPLLNYAVPIVYGGSNYSRFLPPGSYIDAKKLSIKKVVSLMVEAINNDKVYNEFFRWHNHYVYQEAQKSDGICNLCEILNDPKRNYSVTTNFRKWWNPDYKTLCRKYLEPY